MQINLFNYIQERLIELSESRIFVLSSVFAVLALALVTQCFKLQIINGAAYQEQYNMLIQKTKEVKGTRGNIYDRNGTLLAYNELAYAVTIEDNGDYSSTSQKNEVLNDVIARIIAMVESNGDEVISSFKIVLNSKGEYEFVNTEGTSRDRFIADIYGESYITDLTQEQLESTADDIITYLCTDERFGYGIEISDELERKEEILKLVNIRYAMSLNGYRKYLSTTIAEDVSDKTVAVIMENSNELQGVAVEENSLRRYVDSEYFAPIIGYTGTISQDEYDKFVEDGIDSYVLTDMVGKSGIEKEMELHLQGSKGEEKIYVNSVGRVIDTISTTPAYVGDDVYLTIDSDLQKVAYDVLEQMLAGIIVSKLVNQLTVKNENSDSIMIPIGDVYSAFFNNAIIDISNFSTEDASDIEKEIYSAYETSLAYAVDDTISYITNPKGAIRSDISDELNSYVTQVTAYILRTESGILDSTKIDMTDTMYKKWANSNSINAYEYLNYAISQNWVDTNKLRELTGSESTYSDSNEIFEMMILYAENEILNNYDFSLLVYSNLVRTSKVTGSDICQVAYEQGVFDKDDSNYDKIKSGTLNAFSFLKQMIENLELTPAQLGLEPSSGSVVLTDPDSGDVLALVSYPGYDANRLANTMDTKYYNKLLIDSSSPFYNHATQEKTAPGSTYKMVTLAAGLTEGIVQSDTTLFCSGLYEKVSPNPKCWIHPNGHGSVSAETSLQVSCNNYYYELGYRLSLTDQSLIGTDDKLGSTTSDYYSSNLGLSKLLLYSNMFGLGEKTGIELPESEPEISEDASVPSAIGQGTHNYTTAQLARYTGTIASKGTVNELTLLDTVQDTNGTVIEDFKQKESDEITNISQTTWSTIHNGMVRMVEKSSSLKGLKDGVTLAGKTGTAQQSTLKPNHALFIGFTPVNEPELAMAIRIVHGYNSGYAAQIGENITNYFNGAVERDEIVTGKALNLGTAIDGD